MPFETPVHATVILALCLALLAAAQRLPAAVKHLFCTFALALIVLLPAIGQLPSYGERSLLTVTVHPPPPNSLSGGIAWIWLLGSAIVLLRFLLGIVYLAWQTRRASTPVSELTTADVTVRLADIETPVMWGWFRPTILFPFSFPEWTPEEQKAAVDHELAHVARRDSWTALIVVAAQAIYWFHPLVWWLSGKLVEQRECAADDRVLRLGTEPAAYAAFLVSTARRMHRSSLFGCSLVAGSLRRRVERLLTSSHDSPASRPFASAACGLAVLLAGGLISPVRQVYKIGGDILPPRLVHKVEPAYTGESRREKSAGIVLLRLIIGSNGRPQSVAVDRSLTPDLDRQAVRAISAWRFEPATKEGRAVSVQANVEVHFRLL